MFPERTSDTGLRLRVLGTRYVQGDEGLGSKVLRFRAPGLGMEPPLAILDKLQKRATSRVRFSMSEDTISPKDSSRVPKGYAASASNMLQTEYPNLKALNASPATLDLL